MTRPRLALALVFCLLASLVSAQQKPLAKTLLWKISGNGLRGDSYLYGSMHLQDKRVFKLSDSVYHFIGKAEGFAMEINMQEYMDSAIMNVVLGNNSEPDDVEPPPPPPASIELEDVGLKGKNKLDRKTIKRLQKIREEQRKNATKNEMPTILDAWLLHIAARQGKWTGAVEDVADQMNVMNEFGSDISIPDSEDNAAYTQVLEEMIKIYTSQDIDSIYNYTHSESPEALEAMHLHARNRKMATRMDSLSRIRTMFYTIGAAHLSGDTGLIKLLTEKGYTLTPVFSPVSVDATNYASKLVAMPWILNEDLHSNYSVLLPGKASEIPIMGELMRMKMLVDMSNLSFYISISVMADQSANLKSLLHSIANRSAGKIENEKYTANDSIKTAEGVFYAHESHFRVRATLKNNMVYVLMAVRRKKAELFESEVNRYFGSLVIRPRPVSSEAAVWTDLNLDEKGFVISFPGKPKRNSVLERQVRESEWVMTAYDYQNPAKNIYYNMQVLDLKEGFVLNGDSVYFDIYHDKLLTVVKSPSIDERTMIQAHPGLRFEGTGDNNGLEFKVTALIRGHRVYITMVVGPDISGDADVRQYFESFKLLPYQPHKYLKAIAPDKTFTTSTPRPLVAVTKPPLEDVSVMDTSAVLYDSVAMADAANVERQPEITEYRTYDEKSATSFLIYKEVLPPYAWAQNDSAFILQQLAKYIGDRRIIFSKQTMNGRLKGLEILLDANDSHSHKKFRMIINGDTSYMLFAAVTPDDLAQGRGNEFFEDFRITNEITTPIPTTPIKLMSGLQSKDSITFSNALAAYNQATFTSADLPSLHRALVQNYPFDTEAAWMSTRKVTVRHLNALTDNSTIDFVATKYPSLSENEDHVRIAMLDVLANKTNDTSYGLLKRLLLTSPPVNDEREPIGYSILDSAQLTASLFPEALVLLRNPGFVRQFVSISESLLADSLISFEILRPYQDAVYHFADTTFQGKKLAGEDYNYIDNNLFDLLARFNNPAGFELIRKFLTLEVSHLTQPAVIALLKANEKVDPAAIEKLASSVVWRASLFDELEKIGKLNQMPAKFSTQRSVAESRIFQVANEELESEEIKYVGERVLVFQGQKRKFLLYKVTYNYEDDTERHLGITGPYEVSGKNGSLKNDITGIFFEEYFDDKKIDQQLKKFLVEAAETQVTEE